MADQYRMNTTAPSCHEKYKVTVCVFRATQVGGDTHTPVYIRIPSWPPQNSFSLTVFLPHYSSPWWLAWVIVSNTHTHTHTHMDVFTRIS